MNTARGPEPTGPPPEARELLAFWFADGMDRQWFRGTQALDERIRTRFEATWRSAAAGELDDWDITADGALALAVLLDQLPLNMFRGQRASFATLDRAICVARGAVGRGLDRQLSRDRVAFLYMPLMHSECLADQDLSVALFSAAGLADNLRFARHHRELVRRFGRFPHRNAVLGRDSGDEERRYLASPQAFTG